MNFLIVYNRVPLQSRTSFDWGIYSFLKSHFCLTNQRFSLLKSLLILNIFLKCSLSCLTTQSTKFEQVFFTSKIIYFQFLTNKGKKVVELKWKEKTEGAGTGNGPAPETAKVFVQKLQMFSQVVLTLKEKSEYEFSAILNYPLNWRF